MTAADSRHLNRWLVSSSRNNIAIYMNTYYGNYEMDWSKRY